MTTIYIKSDREQALIDKHFRVKCPHCSTHSGLSAISLPRLDLLKRYEPKSVGVAYQCDACRETVFLRFPVGYDWGNNRAGVSLDYTEIERPQEDYDFAYLPKEVEADFREALLCYSSSCFNAFGAMCRRTVQSASTALGAKGKNKVQKQIQELQSVAGLDEESYQALEAVVLAGHDGAHPHLPALGVERAKILLELMKDVLYQLFVRKKKIEEATQKRDEAIENGKK